MTHPKLHGIFLCSQERWESITLPPTHRYIADIGKFLNVESRFCKYNFTYNTGVFGVRDFEFFKRYAFEYFDNIYKLELHTSSDTN